MTRALRTLLAGLLALAAFLAVGGTAQAATTVTVTPNSLQGWDFAETRATGHYGFTATGLAIYTEGTTSTDKVAGYKPVTALLAQAAADEPTLQYNPASGPVVGYQLVIDLNGPAAGGFTQLVYEPVYATAGRELTWWSTSSRGAGPDHPLIHTEGGHGSAAWATLDDWATEYPAATISAFGFSLGSGVFGGGTLTRVTFLGTDYVFRPDAQTPTTTVPAPTSTTAPTTTAAPTTSAAPDPDVDLPPVTTSSPSSTATAATSTPGAGSTTTATTSAAVPPVVASGPPESIGREQVGDYSLASTGAPVASIIGLGAALLLAGIVITTVTLRTRAQRKG